MSLRTACGPMPTFSSTGGTMPSLSSSRGASRWSGSSSGLPCSEARPFARCPASWALTVNLSQRMGMGVLYFPFVILSEAKNLCNRATQNCIKVRSTLLRADFRFAQDDKLSNCKTTGRRAVGQPPARSNRAALDDRVRDAVPHERLWSLAKFQTYAALLGPLPSRVFSTPAPMLTLICLGLASAFLGNAIFNTPLS